MGAVGEQLVHRRGALAVRDRQARAPTMNEFILAAEGAGQRREIERVRRCFDLIVGLGGELAELDAGTGLYPERPADIGLQREQSGLLLTTVGQELLLAADARIAVEILDPAGAAPA